MKHGRTLQELALEIDRQRAMKRDFVVPARNISLTSDTHGRCFTLANGEHSEQFLATSLFHSQMAAALDIPAKYYQLMQSEHPQLLEQNVNGWLARSPRRHTVRTLDGCARAFLSDRYRRLDNHQVIEAVLPIIGDLEEAGVESCEVTDSHLYLKVVNPRLEAEVVPGDVVQSGVMISNSEVGQGALAVTPLVYRLVCANGMVVNDFGTRKHHVGRASEEEWSMFSAKTLAADDQAFMLKLQDIVRAVVDTARFSHIVDKLREAADAPIEGHITEVVELTARLYSLNHGEQDTVLRRLIEGRDLSQYGLSNAVTATAQTLDDYDRSTELESVGWQIASMAPSTWKRLNAVN